MEKHKQEQEITNTQAPTTEKATKTMPKTGRESNSHKPNDNQARGTLDNLEMTKEKDSGCLLYTSPSPRDLSTSRMPSSA